MSQGERKLADETGRFTQAVVDGRARNQLSWQKARLVLSNRRLIVASSEGKQTIPLAKISKIGGRADVNQAVAAVPEYVSIHIDDDVFLIETSNVTDFELSLYKALLDRSTVEVKHPAVEGGVVQNEPWVTGRVQLEETSVALALSSGTLVDVELADVTTVETERRDSEQHPAVVNITHSDDGTSVVTAASGSLRDLRLLATYIRSRSSDNEVSLELDQREREVLMALYSGVSPFEIPEFVGIEVETLEEIYDTLIEANVVEEVRVRREVALTARGRNLASEAMSEQ